MRKLFALTACLSICLVAGLPARAQRLAPARIQGVRGLALSPDGMTLASADKRTIRLWDTARLALKTVIQTPETPVQSIVFSPDSSQLISVSSRTVHVWDMKSGEEVISAVTGLRAVAVAFSPDGRRLALVGWGTLRILDLATGQGTTLHDPGVEASSVLFSADGNYIYIGSADYTVRVWDTRTQQRFVLTR